MDQRNASRKLKNCNRFRRDIGNGPHVRGQDLFRFLIQTPNQSERIAPFARTNQTVLLQRLYGARIRTGGPEHFTVLPPENRIASERISLKLVTLLQVR